PAAARSSVRRLIAACAAMTSGFSGSLMARDDIRQSRPAARPQGSVDLARHASPRHSRLRALTSMAMPADPPSSRIARLLLTATRVWLPLGIAAAGVVAIVVGGGSNSVLAGAGVALVLAAL